MYLCAVGCWLIFALEWCRTKKEPSQYRAMPRRNWRLALTVKKPPDTVGQVGIASSRGFGRPLLYESWPKITEAHLGPSPLQSLLSIVPGSPLLSYGQLFVGSGASSNERLRKDGREDGRKSVAPLPFRRSLLISPHFTSFQREGGGGRRG
ncbi:hypothetical protein N657DRAFT_322247 [Parathielavia appendiculata]|uniref:Uncharacterized protein n=1 Tax=Parathielavia appendiculata TaxID=2587402 RepID=A0AAN6TQV4_9PEZI|nr:hypothetical protein N657DRAFT_322247 [Parathielavia appendiculata]